MLDPRCWSERSGNPDMRYTMWDMGYRIMSPGGMKKSGGK
jgi:hypothetical protein